jgi:hypothetical protein
MCAGRHDDLVGDRARRSPISPSGTACRLMNCRAGLQPEGLRTVVTSQRNCRLDSPRGNRLRALATDATGRNFRAFLASHRRLPSALPLDRSACAPATSLGAQSLHTSILAECVAVSAAGGCRRISLVLPSPAAPENEALTDGAICMLAAARRFGAPPSTPRSFGAHTATPCFMTCCPPPERAPAATAE